MAMVAGVKSTILWTDPFTNAPLQKVFVDDFSLRLGDRAVALINPGFEAEKLRLNFDPLPLLDYRDALADCLEECVTALGVAARAP